jgi:membrane protein implicated in regulation of membrane protease activity
LNRQNAKVFARYWVLQIPGMFAAGIALVMLVRWTELTPTLAGVLFGLWVLKDLAMFPVTRIAYESRKGYHGSDALVGALGIAQDAFAPGGTGYVRVGAELWRAQAEDGERIAKGATLRVMEVRDLTLRVERVPVQPT